MGFFDFRKKKNNTNEIAIDSSKNKQKSKRDEALERLKSSGIDTTEIKELFKSNEETLQLSDKGIEYFDRGDYYNAEKTFISILNSGHFTQPTYDRLIHIYKKRNDINNLEQLLERPTIDKFPYMVEDIERFINEETLQQIEDNIKKLSNKDKYMEAIQLYDEKLKVYKINYTKHEYLKLAFSKAKFLIKNKKNDEAWKLYNKLASETFVKNQIYYMSPISKERAKLLKKEKRYKDSFYNHILSFLYKDLDSFLSGRIKNINLEWLKLKYLEDILIKANLQQYKNEIYDIIERYYSNYDQISFNNIDNELRKFLKLH